MKTIIRELYLNRLILLRNTPDIKIITGIRRCGKSQLMQTYIHYLEQNFSDTNIIFIDFMDLDFENLKEYHSLHKYIEEHYIKEKNNYLFIDEIQLCPNFELTINSLYSKIKYDIYITGSKAFLLSNDLATLFTGRYIEIPIFPFSFSEYCQYYDFFDNEIDIEKAFDSYTVNGGLPGSYVYKTEQDKQTYIKEVYETIVTRDLVQKYKITNSVALQSVSEFLMDNISNITSPNKISDILTNNHLTTNHITVSNYIKYLCNAFIFYKIKRFDIKGKKYLESLDKYYIADTSIRFALLGSRNIDYGRMYENIVCIELFRRGYDVYIGKLYQKEIDFVVQKGNEKIYIQVCDNLSDEKTFKREVEPLLKIRDAYPKIILARTRHDKYNYEGIDIYNITSWLLDTKKN